MSSFTKFVKPRAPLTSSDFYRRRAQKRRNSVLTGALPSLDQIIDPENLIEVYRQLEKKAGKAPGADGVTYRDLSKTEVATCMRTVSELVKLGLYRPSESLLVKIPKSSGKKNRTLALRSILDRVLSAALNNALIKFWDPKFLPGSMGFRPKLGPWDMLIKLERTIVNQNRWILAIDDIRDAFDHVNLNDLINDHRRHIEDQKLLSFITLILRGGTNPARTEGIEQGNAYSPTALNVRLHQAHDLGFSQDPKNPPWLRYADNLCYPCQSVPEGLQALEQSKALLQIAGFVLKNEDGPPVDVREKKAQLLGFQLSHLDGQVGYGLGVGAYDGLKRNLERAHQARNPPRVAQCAMRGWVGAYGPAFEGKRGEVLERVLQIAASYGFQEISPDTLWENWQSSWERWQKRRKAT